MKSGKTQRSMTQPGRLCCEGAIDPYRARKSALRSLDRATALVHCLRHVPQKDLQTLQFMF